jgi:hypothetical protein
MIRALGVRVPPLLLETEAPHVVTRGAFVVSGDSMVLRGRLRCSKALSAALTEPLER